MMERCCVLERSVGRPSVHHPRTLTPRPALTLPFFSNCALPHRRGRDECPQRRSRLNWLRPAAASLHITSIIQSRAVHTLCRFHILCCCCYSCSKGNYSYGKLSPHCSSCYPQPNRRRFVFLFSGPFFADHFLYPPTSKWRQPIFPFCVMNTIHSCAKRYGPCCDSNLVLLRRLTNLSSHYL